MVILDGEYKGPSPDTTALDPSELFGGFTKEPEGPEGPEDELSGEQQQSASVGERVISLQSCLLSCHVDRRCRCPC